MALLAARAPKLRRALQTAKKHAYVVLDGTLIPIDRLAADRPFYSGKHRRHGMNLRFIAGPDGDVLSVLGEAAARPRPDRRPDPDILRDFAAAGLITLADKGCIGAA